WKIRAGESACPTNLYKPLRVLVQPRWGRRFRLPIRCCLTPTSGTKSLAQAETYPTIRVLDRGTKLGPYEILDPLGAGGMGEVYKARDTRLDRIVAIKVLPAKFAEHPEFRQRLEREARAVSSLNHPHICALYDVGRQDGIDFLVLEYLEGE